MKPPLQESFTDQKLPFMETTFYYPQLDWIRRYSKGKNWTWCDTRPDVIVGFVPNNNFYSLATSIGIFLALQAAINGVGFDCAFPGCAKSWVAKSNDSSSDMIARQTIHLSLNGFGNGEGHNVADARKWENWESKWPKLCAYFGLKGTPPTEATTTVNKLRKYIYDHLADWRVLEKEHNLRTGIADSDITHEGFEYFLLTQFDFDRQYDMAKMYSTGFTEERGIMETWGVVFDRMREAKIIPDPNR
ncbi:hypothetical protein LTR66_003500 [Elasticomyces elasticus]|nr:hypothetical protein LTR28_013079 [Elasticomyces elasticus]KAK4997010.1 hypothetical protein LTR66_003500 [Elasticomyces elasticus]